MAQTERLRSIDDLDIIVDSDVHLTERQEDILPYIDSPFEEMLERNQGDDYGYLDSFYPSPGFLTPVHTGKVQSETVRTKDQLKQGMELLGTDRVVITPTQNLYLGCVQHDELAAALANAYNEFLLDQILEPESGLYGAVLVAPQKPERAAEEIDRLANEAGIIAAFVPSGGVSPPLGHERYNPIYEATERAGLPLMMHNAAGTMMMSFPFQFQGFSRYLSSHVPAHAMQHMTHLASMITHGVPVRYSNLDFVIQEAGLGWIPYFMRRFDHEYSAKREDAPLLEQLPSEYIHDQFYFTSQPVEGANDPEYVRSIINLLNGKSNLLFSSDYPHLDFDHSEALFNMLRGQLDDEALANIYGQTATEVFQF